jgi:L-2-hydroxyglutarate oxidase
MSTCDFLVIGGGVIGLSIARELRRRHPAAKIIVLDKEPRVDAHASGRNSGVLHAGFYYSPDSLKARLTRIGNERMTAYCLERTLPIRRCGKLVVAHDETELPRLHELHRRGVANGVDLRVITDDDARDIEPRARTHQQALWSPATSSVDPHAVMASLLADARAESIDVRLSTRWRKGAMDAGFVVNAAGLYADRIARDFGFAEHYRILPFKGLYLYSNEPAGAFRTHVYPVPDPRFPFLGVHFTVTVDGKTKIGPTAVPAFWREQYGTIENFRAGEFADVVMREASLLLRDRDFRALAFEEIRKYSRRRIVRLAARLAMGVTLSQYTPWGRPVIRAQLVDTRTGKLESDFVIERDDRSLHVLNAVSPGFTCAFSFAEYVVDQIA